MGDAGGQYRIEFVVHPLLQHRARQRCVDADPAALRIGFVGADDPNTRAPFLRWLAASPAQDRIVFRTNDMAAMMRAVLAGTGIGFLSTDDAQGRSELIEVMPSRPEWNGNIWIVTHVDLHRSPKVQAFLKALKQAYQQIRR